MKKLRLTESELINLVKKIIKENNKYRGKFKGEELWTDEEDEKITSDFDKDLAASGYYDEDPGSIWQGYREEGEYEKWEDIPEDLPHNWMISKKHGTEGKKWFDRYKETYGPLRVSKRI